MVEHIKYEWNRQYEQNKTVSGNANRFDMSLKKTQSITPRC